MLALRFRGIRKFKERSRILYRIYVDLSVGDANVAS